MTLALIICLALGVIFGLGLLIGAGIHAGNPLPEHPIRTMKLRGEHVDMVA